MAIALSATPPLLAAFPPFLTFLGPLPTFLGDSAPNEPLAVARALVSRPASGEAQTKTLTHLSLQTSHFGLSEQRKMGEIVATLSHHTCVF